MLTIICGEDSIASREYFINLKKGYGAKGYEVYHLAAGEFQEINRWLADSLSLFSQKLVFFTENLSKNYSRRGNPGIDKSIYRLIDTKEAEVIDWEEFTPARELKLLKGAAVKEFKPDMSIFKLVDACYPGNLKNFLRILNDLPIKIDDGFIFIMLARHIRNLLLIKSGETNSKLQSWQVYKLKGQARHWELNSLTSFYDGLHRIDVSSKTGRNPFSIKKSLEILACYFL